MFFVYICSFVVISILFPTWHVICLSACALSTKTQKITASCTLNSSKKFKIGHEIGDALDQGQVKLLIWVFNQST